MREETTSVQILLFDGYWAAPLLPEMRPGLRSGRERADPQLGLAADARWDFRADDWGGEVSRLLDELRRDPDAVFEVRATLPSGNQMMAAVGPVIGENFCVHVEFALNPPSEADIDTAKQAINLLLGMTPQYSATAHTREQKIAALRERRRFLGGGEG